MTYYTRFYDYIKAAYYNIVIHGSVTAP